MMKLQKSSPPSNLSKSGGDSRATAKRIPFVSLAIDRVGKPDRIAHATDLRGGFQQALLAFLQSKTASPSVPVEHRLFLTLTESAEFSGLPVAFLRRLIAAGKLKALRTGSGWRVARGEMETVAATLTDQPEEISADTLRDMEINRRRRQGLTG